MGSRSKGYWILLGLAIAAVVAALVMRRSDDSAVRDYGRILGWSAIGILVIARLFFRGKPADPSV
jgi:hypothetical protein